MNSILQDILGLFKKRKIVKTLKGTDYFPLATFKNKKDPLRPNPERETVIISSTDLKTYISDGITHTLNTTNVLTVMKGGNDASALTAGKYDSLAPWLNPTIAMASAAVGDVVVVYPGEYTIGVGGNVTDDGSQPFIKNGVTLYMMPGAIINYTNKTGTVGSDVSLPFFDGGVASTFTIRGKGKFVFNKDISGGDSWLTTTHEDTIVDWEFDYIDIRKRWGGTGYAAIKWRMVGRRYHQRESMIFAFRNTGTLTDRFVDIDIEDVEIGSEMASNTTWTRQECRDFGAGSVVNIHYGKVVYPNGYSAGAFHQNTSCATGSIINLQIDSIERTGVLTTTMSDYIVVNASSFQGGVTKITNINTQTGIENSNGMWGSSETRRATYYQGTIRDGYTGGTVNTVRTQVTNITTTIELDLVMLSTNANFRGIVTYAVPNNTITGIIRWSNGTNSPLYLFGGVDHGYYKNFVISITTAIDSMFNSQAAVADIRILNVYATNAVSTANGGVNPLIEAITIDSNI